MNTPLRIVALVILAAAVIAAQTRSGPDLYQEALHLQDVKGDLPAAIVIYKTIVDRYAKDRPLAAKALLQLGACYEKLGRTEARQAYERIVRDFADVPDVASRARAQLSAMGASSTDPFKVKTLDPVLELSSPDGRYAIYHKDTGETSGRIVLRDTRTGAERVIVDVDGAAGSAVWSPDSRQLAFGVQNVQQKLRELRILTIATGETRTLPAREAPAAWLPDGSLVLYRMNYPQNTMEFLTMPASGGEQRQFLSSSIASGSIPAPLPDLKSFVVAKANRLVLVDAATGAERAITTGTAEESYPMLSADGRLVAFTSNPDGKWALYVAPLDQIPVREPLRLAYIDPAGLGGGRGQRQPWWLPSGDLSLVLADADSDVFRVDVDRATGRTTSGPVRLTQDASVNRAGVVSPDGKQIAYWYRQGRKAGVAVMDADGRNERHVVEQSGSLPLGWRAPGEILFYDFATPKGQKPAITVYDVKTGTQKPLAQLTGLYWKYVPARQEILHSHPGGGGPKPGLVLRARSLADGTDRDVATIDNLLPWFVPSPDGRYIAVTTTSEDPMRTRCETALMTIDGRKERVLVPMQQPCVYTEAWSPDGRFLLLNGPKGPSVLDIASAKSWPLFEGSTSDPRSPVLQYARGSSWSPVGSFITLTVSQTRIARLAWDGVTYDAVVKVMKRSGGGR